MATPRGWDTPAVDAQVPAYLHAPAGAAQPAGPQRHSAEKTFELLHPRLLARAVPRTALAQGRLECLQQFFLALVEVDRGFDARVAIEIAGRVRAHVAYALAAQAEHLAGLGAGRDLEIGAPIESRNFHFTAECCCREAHRHLAVQVVAVAFEQIVRLEAHLHIQIARRSAALAGLTLAREPNLVAFIHAGRHFHRQGLADLDAPLAVAGIARALDHLAAAAARGTGLLDGEESLLHAHLAVAAAGCAGRGRGPGLGAAA